MTSQRGFTLIEMALVLAIIGLIVGGGVMALGPMVDKSRVNQTNTNMDQIENALVLFAIRNNRLPCPADGSLIAGSNNYGLEQGTTNCAVAANHSVVPWRTLGLDETYSTDGWSRRISYFVANAANGANPSLTVASALLRNGSTYPSSTTFQRVNDTGGHELTTTLTGGDGAAYVLVSHGKSGWYGWNKAGNAIAASGGGAASPNKAANAGGPIFVQGSPNPTNTIAFFDDIVRWRSASLIIQLCGSGACGNP